MADMSASSNITAGSLPPSSSVTRFRSLAPDAITFLPVAVDPVKVSLRGMAWAVIAAPSGSGPAMTFSTPGGRTDCGDCPTAGVQSGVEGDGFVARVFQSGRAAWVDRGGQ